MLFRSLYSSSDIVVTTCGTSSFSPCFWSFIISVMKKIPMIMIIIQVLITNFFLFFNILSPNLSFSLYFYHTILFQKMIAYMYHNFLSFCIIRNSLFTSLYFLCILIDKKYANFMAGKEV